MVKLIPKHAQKLAFPRPLHVTSIQSSRIRVDGAKPGAPSLAKLQLFNLFRYIFLFLSLTTPLMTSCSQGGKIDNDQALAAAGPIKTTNRELIVLDPGHGGFDIGAAVRSIEEKALALKTATLVKQYLHQKGYRVILTRSRDVFISLAKRSNIANGTKSKLFVSIHYNAFKNPQVSGIEVYYYNQGNQWRRKKSKQLATLVLNGMITATLYPLSFIFRTRFCPITASPISPISALPATIYS
jgi:N-acetylmuramoyl-L-alanine amidase